MDIIVPLMGQYYDSNPTTCCCSPASSTRAASPAPPSAWACPSRPSRGGWPRWKPASASACCCAPRASSRVTEFGQAVLAHARHVAEDVEAAESLAAAPPGASPAAGCGCRCPTTSRTWCWRRCSPQFVAALSEDLARSRPVRALRRPGRRELRRRAAHGRPARRRHPRGAPRSPRSAASLYASPAYLARRGTPSRAGSADGARHAAGADPRRATRCAGSSPRRAAMGRRPAGSRDRQLARAPDAHGPRRRGNRDSERSLRIALPWSAASSSRCCPTGGCRRSTLWAVFPGRRLMPARTRVFLDALAAKFSGPECQARGSAGSGEDAARSATARARSGVVRPWRSPAAASRAVVWPYRVPGSSCWHTLRLPRGRHSSATPRHAATIDATNTAIFAAAKSSAVGIAWPAMNSDMVKPMPASAPAPSSCRHE